MLIHVLTPGFDTPNGRAFLFPLVVWRKPLATAGLHVRLFKRVTPDLTDCDVLLIDSKFYRADWSQQGARILDDIAALASACRVVFCDTTDSASWLKPEVLPLVHVYAKGQVHRDRAAYGQAYYGLRSYSDYYHRAYGIDDAEPEVSTPVTDPALQAKIRVSWNTGLADYSLHGPLRMAAYGRLPLPGLLRFPTNFTSAEAPRPNAVSCRFGTSYSRASVAAQRRLIRAKLADRTDTRKLSRRNYFGELGSSRVVVSPFGFGEITLKDFEVFLTGGALLKPDVSHMETWPDLFRAGDTVLSHRWDLSDFDAILEDTVAHPSRVRDLAMQGQVVYRNYINSVNSVELFAKQMTSLVVT